MKRTRTSYMKWASASAGAIAASAMLATVAHAQSTTGIVRGQAPANATIVARDVARGITSRATSGPDGAYVLPGLRPATYELTITGPAGETSTQTVTLGVGQTIDVDFLEEAAADDANMVEELVVTAARTRTIEMETSEVATNVTTQQIENLPQNQRNFLNFAALAPGVRVSDDPERRTFAAGAQSANAVNVFIDGQNLKNNVLQGGLVGQEASRGNPFPQAAVQEFRVSTQNHKAEYEQAGSAIITAVTRAGTNELEGEVFYYFQNKDMVEDDPFDVRANRPKPDYERKQFGGWVGGPIIPDRLFYFFTYEGNYQDRFTRVTLDPGLPQAIRDQYEGNFLQPFREDLFFGKLTWVPMEGHQVNLGVTKRQEEDIRDFGGNTTRERARDIQNEVLTTNLRWTWDGEGFLNEAVIDYQEFSWAPTPISGERSETLDGRLSIGAATYSQDKGQTALSLRNDFSLTNLEWYGQHLLKVGARVAFYDYTAAEYDHPDPEYIYAQNDVNFTTPIRAVLGFGDPSREGENTQVGLFIQDDWEVNDNLTLNLGLRWDYESNMLNNDFVTPADVAARLRAYPNNKEIDWDRYISTGSERESFTGAWQPRLGFSYDITGEERWVVFGGAGRYYDRVLFDYAQVEEAKHNFRVFTINFNETTPWNDAYYDEETLRDIITTAGGYEVYALANDVPVPYSDQFNIGLRHRFDAYGHTFNAAITFSKILSYNGFSWVVANRTPEGNFPRPPWGYGPPEHPNVIVSESEDETDTNSVYITFDKPYTRASRWGVNLAYTYMDAEQFGNPEPYGLDEPSAEAWGTNQARVDDHRLVFSGQVSLPWDIMASTLITLASGTPYNFVDVSQGWGSAPNEGLRFRLNRGEPEKYDFIFKDAWAYRNVDIRLSKDVTVWGGHQVGVILDVINVFNFANYGYGEWSSGFIPPEGPGGNPNFGKPERIISPMRSLQVGLRYRF